MAHLRDRRAFGNIGTRRFRGARFGDPLSPRGPQYTLKGRVLDYSTDVGPFTIVDKSGEGNTATLYSGRGLTMDGVGDLIDFGSPTFSEPVTSITGYARSTDTSINLGLTSATLAGNDTWETFSADTAAKDYGDAQWFNGTNTSVDTGIAWYRPSAWAWEAEIYLSSLPTGRDAFIGSGISQGENFYVSSSGHLGLFVATRVNYVSNVSVPLGRLTTVRVERTSSGNAKFYVDGSLMLDTTVLAPNAHTNPVIVGKFSTGGNYFKGLIKSASWEANGVPIVEWTDTNGLGTPSGTFVTAAQHFTNPDFILGTGYNGDLSDVRCLGATGTVLGHWSLADWSNPSGNTSNGKTIVDSGPNKLHGTCTGCSGFTGEATIPQTADKNWNKYQWFNGTDTTVALGANAMFAIQPTDSFAISFSALLTQSVTRNSIIGWRTSATGSVGWILRTEPTTGVIRFFIYDNSSFTECIGTTDICDSVIHDVSVSHNGAGSFAVTIDGSPETLASSQNNATAVTYSTLQAYLGAIEISSGVTERVDGLLYSIDYVKNATHAAYTGIGNDPWRDTIGSNDGTELGTFTRELVSASDANDQIDALGTAILEPRLNTQQLNLFGDGEYSSTPDSASLDLTTAATWELWGNFYGAGTGSSQYIFSKYLSTGDERSWGILKSSSGTADSLNVNFGNPVNGIFFGTATWSMLEDKLQQITLVYTSGAISLYLDGVFQSTITLAIPTSLYAGTAPVTLGALSDGVAPFSGQEGSAKLYNVALTADEVLTNYNTQKSLYGL